MTISSDSTVGNIATAHPLSTRVFARHGIDFCCGGGKALADACAEKGIELDGVLAELNAELSSGNPGHVNWANEPLNVLIDHILKNYHEPLREELPRIEAMARKVNAVHGDKDPARFEGILATYLTLKVGLEEHMLKEEEVLFPMIRNGQGDMADGPISVMESEHLEAGAALARLRGLTEDYSVPDEACNTWRALWVGLADLERALHEHIHLENNILHRRALDG